MLTKSKRHVQKWSSKHAIKKTYFGMKLFISNDYKVFPINLHFLNIVGICPKHFTLTWKKHFSRRKGSQKVHKKGHTNFFHFTDTNVYKNSILLFRFFFIWLSVKYKDFLIISNLSQIFHVFILLYKDKSKVQKCNMSDVH